MPVGCAPRIHTDWAALERAHWQAEDTLDPEARLLSRSAAWGNLDAWVYARTLALRSAA